MMPSNGSVSPRMKAMKTMRPAAGFKWPSANPARVAMRSAIGTTPSSMSTLDHSSSSIRADWKASTKFSQCGSSGRVSPPG